MAHRRMLQVVGHKSMGIRRGSQSMSLSVINVAVTAGLLEIVPGNT